MMTDNEITLVVGWPTETEMVKYRSVAKAAWLAALAQQAAPQAPSVPDGFVLVPREADDDDLWLDAMDAFEAAVPQHQRGFSEWCSRLQAALEVLAAAPHPEKQP